MRFSLQVDQSLFTFGINYASIRTGAYRQFDLTNPYWDQGRCQFFAADSAFDIEKRFTYFLPQLNWKFTQSEKLVYQLYFGRHVILPKLRDVYMRRLEQNTLYYGGLFFPFPKGPNADPVKATDLSFLLEYDYSAAMNLQLAVFQRSSNSWLQSKYIQTQPLSSVTNYATLSNEGESRGRGFELNIKLQKQGIRFDGNYTFSSIKGSTSYPNSNVFDAQRENPLFNRDKQHNLEFNQRHRINAWLTLQATKDRGMFIHNSTLSLLYQFNSGHTFWQFDGSLGGITSPEYGSILSNASSRGRKNPFEITTPWIHKFDLMLQRRFAFGRFQPRIFLMGQNVLNRKNVEQVYWRTSNTANDGTFAAWEGLENIWINEYGTSLPDFYQKINIEHRQHYARLQGGDLFGHPREIRFGMALDFDR